MWAALASPPRRAFAHDVVARLASDGSGRARGAALPTRLAAAAVEDAIDPGGRGVAPMLRDGGTVTDEGFKLAWCAAVESACAVVGSIPRAARAEGTTTTCALVFVGGEEIREEARRVSPASDASDASDESRGRSLVDALAGALASEATSDSREGSAAALFAVGGAARALGAAPARLLARHREALLAAARHPAAWVRDAAARALATAAREGSPEPSREEGDDEKALTRDEDKKRPRDEDGEETFLPRSKSARVAADEPGSSPEREERPGGGVSAKGSLEASARDPAAAAPPPPRSDDASLRSLEGIAAALRADSAGASRSTSSARRVRELAGMLADACGEVRVSATRALGELSLIHI